MASTIQGDEPHTGIFWIVLLSISLRLVPPLGEGETAFMINPDAMYHFQVAQTYAERGAWFWGLETERASHFVFFPFLQILSMQVSTVSGLPLYQLCRFLPTLFSVGTVLVVFVAYRSMLGSRAAIAGSLLFSVCYKYNWFDGTYIQESLGVLFFSLVFYSIALRTNKPQVRRSAAAVFFVGTAALAMTHFFSSIMLAMGLVLFLALVHLSGVASSKLRISGRDLLSFFVILGIWLGFVAIIPMVQGITYSTDYSSAMLRLVMTPFQTLSPQQPTGIHLTTAQAAIMYAGFLAAGGVGLLAVLKGLRLLRAGRQAGAEGMVQVLSFGGVAMVFGLPAALGIFLSPPDNPDIPYRLITFIFFFWAPAFGAGISLVREHVQRPLLVRVALPRSSKVLGSLFMMILLVLPVASTWLLLPSTMLGHTRLDDAEVNGISSWLRSNGDRSVTLMGDSVMTAATAALARQLSSHGRLGKSDLMLNAMFYYGESKAPLIQMLGEGQSVYLLFNKAYLNHGYYLSTYFYEGKPPPSESDIGSSLGTLNNLSTLNIAYCSSSITLYTSAGVKRNLAMG